MLFRSRSVSQLKHNNHHYTFPAKDNLFQQMYDSFLQIRLNRNWETLTEDGELLQQSLLLSQVHATCLFLIEKSPNIFPVTKGTDNV